MPYTSNPYAPSARMKARNDVVWRKLSLQQAADKYGVARSTIWKWVKKVEQLHLDGNTYIWTLSSAPKTHPNQIKPEVEARIIALREKLKKRCAPVIHRHLLNEGIQVSLSSVERTLRRHHLTRKRRYASWYTPLPRPPAIYPGALVQMDTIHYVRSDNTRFYLYTLIDIYSRLAYAEYHTKLSQQISFAVILRAQQQFGFRFRMLQTDNGPEFRDWLQGSLGSERIKIRHSRVRKPNDNAHIERFNRTIQEECFQGRLPNEETITSELKSYIAYYNNDRLHLSLDVLTPTQFVSKVLK